MFVFGYEAPTTKLVSPETSIQLDSLLGDRCYQIWETDAVGYTYQDKAAIFNTFLYESFITKFNMSGHEVTFTPDIIYYILDRYCGRTHKGLRPLMHCMECIFLKLNLMRLSNDGGSAIPRIVSKDLVDITMSGCSSDTERSSTASSMYV